MSYDLDRLAQKAQRGDEWARDRLFGECRKRLDTLARVHRGSLEIGDAQSVAYEAFIEALEGFDPSRGAAFTTFLHLRVRTRIRDASKRACAGRRRLETAADDALAQVPAPEPAKPSVEQPEGPVVELDPVERHILALHASGEGFRSIARRIHRSHEFVRKLIRDVMFRQVLLTDPPPGVEQEKSERA